jgi:hypothetical protein
MKENKPKTIPIAKSHWKGQLVRHRTDRLNVKLVFNPKKPDEALLRNQAAEICKLIRGAEIFRLSLKSGKLVIKVPEGTNIVEAAELLARRPEVVYAEPDLVTNILSTPNDSRYGEQWALTKINAEGAWGLTTGDAGILVADIDTGISWQGGSLTHPDLDDASRYTLGTDFVGDDTIPNDLHGHGTHTCGTAAAETDNSTGIAGMNWTSPVYICRIFDANGNGSESDFQSAVEEIVDYAVAHNLKAVLNLSAGWFSDSGTLSDACQYVDDHGMILCVATGNEGGTLRFPATHSLDFGGVIAVGATDSSDAVADFSNVGPAVTVVAPGVGILSTFPTYDVSGDTAHDFVSWDGTSMATPHVTGLASLVWSKETRLSNDEVRDVMVNTAVKLGAGDFDNSWGHGRVDAAEAVAKAGWELTPVQVNLNFIDIPEGETQLRAIRIDVKSFHATAFEMSTLPAAPFSMHNYAPPVTIGKTIDYDTPREVLLWVKYTGTTAGAVANGMAQARCTTTGQVFNVTITANTIARPTCAMMLVLDKSGSMLDPSGVGTSTREQILRYSAGILMSYVRENNGVGIVTFDQDAHDLLNPVAGPFGAPDDPFDSARSSATTALGLYAANPAGLTAIGDGLQRAHDLLSTVTGYDKKATIVLTDGFETARQYITDVASTIDEQVFAVGLGTAEELNPAALNQICNGHGGYLLLTDALDDDDTFKLAKYFLQIQAGVNNEQIVVDPSGYVGQGQTVKIPFWLNETDISADAIVLLPLQGVVDVGIETPQGTVIHRGNVASFPTVKLVERPNVTYYRMTLPVNDGAAVDAHAGQWHILLRIDDKHRDRFLRTFASASDYSQAAIHGAKYTAMVHAYSNLRMSCKLAQASYEPGAMLYLRAQLSEYGAPLQMPASVRAGVTLPDGTSTILTLHATVPGTYEAALPANLAGIYRFVVRAIGLTSRQVPFTREQLVTGAVWKGGDRLPPSSTNDPNENPTQRALCGLLHCLGGSISTEVKERLKKEGFDIVRLTECYCHTPPKRTLQGPVIRQLLR